jgi:hypothetical protein
MGNILYKHNLEWVGVIFGAIMLFISITNSKIKCNRERYVQDEYKFAAKYN